MMVSLLTVLTGQVGKPVHPEHKAPATVMDDLRPVTAREAAVAFQRISGLLKRVTGVSLGEVPIPSLNRPVTRDEIVTEMDRIYRIAAPSFRFTPVPVQHDPAVLLIDKRLRTALDRLVAMGCVARIGPLAVGPSPNLSPKEVGDAIGLFMARIAQISHQPSSKWTPILKSD